MSVTLDSGGVKALGSLKQGVSPVSWHRAGTFSWLPRHMMECHPALRNEGQLCVHVVLVKLESIPQCMLLFKDRGQSAGKTAGKGSDSRWAQGVF